MVAEALRESRSLETLKVKSDNIGDDGAIALAKSLAFLPKMRTLELSGTWALDERFGA